MNRDDLQRIIARALFDRRVADKPGAWDDQLYVPVVDRCFDEARSVVDRLIAAGMQVEPGPEPNRYIITFRDGAFVMEHRPPDVAA